MKKTRYATAIELRKADVELDRKFARLSEYLKWEWAIYACDDHTPYQSLAYARRLIDINSTTFYEGL